MRSKTAIKDRVEQAIVEEINTNLTANKEPENYLPIFIQQLTNRLTEIIQDEIKYGK